MTNVSVVGLTNVKSSEVYACKMLTQINKLIAVFIEKSWESLRYGKRMKLTEF